MRWQDDQETTTTGVATTMVCRCMCDYRHYSLGKEERLTTMTGEMMAQREGSHYDTTTRMTAMTTIMQDGLQERSDKKIRTSLDYVIRLTDKLRLLLLLLLLLGGVVTFDLPMLTFDLPMLTFDLPMLTFDLLMLTFDLPKRSVLQKETDLGRSKVTAFHGTWWPLIYLGLLSAEINVFSPKFLPILTSNCQKTFKTWNCWTAIFMILKPDMFFGWCFPFFVLFLVILFCFVYFISCFFFYSDFLLLLLWLRSKRRNITEKKRRTK